MMHSSCAYLIEKQMPLLFWYFSIKHAAKMMNVIPRKYKGKLALPFMLVHSVHPDEQAWLPTFSLCYFHHEKDSNARGQIEFFLLLGTHFPPEKKDFCGTQHKI
jgi:hypothetical protein